jgi:hypothetical protein
MRIKLVIGSVATGFGLLAALSIFIEPVRTAWADLSGTRLKPKFILGADGSKLFTPDILHDAQLGVDCKFGLAADAKLRCLPTGADGLMVEVDYTDSKCTVPMALLGWAIPTPPVWCDLVLPKYVFTQGPKDRCSTEPLNYVYPVEGTIQTADRWVKNGTSCTKATSNENVVLLKPEAAATTFAEGTAGTDP